MAGGFRCSSGHTWSGAGAPSTACPVCGDTTVHELAAHEPVRLFVSTDAQATNSSATQSLPDVGTEPAGADTPNESNTSFSSLVVVLTEPGAPTPFGNSVVEFGAGASATVPRSPGSSQLVTVSGTGEFAPPAVPGFDILHEVGRGGMGVVYKARQLNLNRAVALKMILSGAHAGPAERERFRREAEAVAALQHPHIVQIFEIGEANGHPYLALEFVEGGSLAQNLTGEPWPAKRAAALVETLARTMQFAHDAGIVHRDLKPGNVLLGVAPKAPRPDQKADSKSGSVSSKSNLRAAGAPAPKVTDFGLAKRLDETLGGDGTRTGAVMGTPSYIAPEQASGRAKDVGPSADVYALGAILYELITGRPPFRGETPLDTVLQVLHDDPVPPKRLQASVPNDLETICLKCLSKQPNKRYRTAGELADDLDRFLNGEPIRARPLSTWGRGLKWARRHPALAVLLGATVTATAALVMVLSMAYARVSEAVSQKDEEARKAQRERDEAKRLLTLTAELAEENRKRREEKEREAEASRRAAFALQLAQCAMLCERDPLRAAELLDDEARCPRDLRDFAWHYLRRLCQREELRYRGHGEPDPLHAVACAPGGTFVATAGEAGQVRVWDPRTGRTWLVLNGHTGTVRGLAFSPDGGALATAGMDGTVRLWELPVGVLDTFRATLDRLPFLPPIVNPLAKPAVLAPTVTIEAHTGEANCVAFSPDGRGLVSGGSDGRLRWWELGGWRTSGAETAALGGVGAVGAGGARAANPQETHTVWAREIGPGAPVLCVAFAANGTALACGRAEARDPAQPNAPPRASAQVFSGDGRRLVRTLDDHPVAVTAIAVAPDGTTVATALNGKPIAVRLFNLVTRRDRRLFGHSSAVHALAFSGDGQLLASGSFDKSVRLWDVDDGRERSALTGHEQLVRALAFAPDRRTLVSASTDGTAVVWQTALRTHEAADALQPFGYEPPGRERGQSLSAVALSPAAGGLVFADDLNRARTVAIDYAPPGAVRPSGPRGPLVLAPLQYGTPRDLRAVRAAAASADGRSFALAAGTEVLVWQPIPLPGKGPNPPRGAWGRAARVRVAAPVHALRFDPTGRWLATADPDGVRLYDVRSFPLGEPYDARASKLLLAVPHPPALAFHPKEQQIAVALKSGVRVVSFAPGNEGRFVDDLPEAHGTRQVEALAYDVTGARLATGDESGVIKVWDEGPKGRFVPARVLTGHTAKVEVLAFSPNGRTLASGSDDRAVILWDPEGGRERLTLAGHADHVRDVAFTTDGEALVSVSRDGGVKRWRADVREPGT